MEADLALDVALRTDPGKEPSKQINEDACGERKTAFGHLVVVCDGMGGHSGGREASHAALEAMFRTFDEADVSLSAGDHGARGREVLRRSIQRANEAVYALAPPGNEISRPGSTVVAILIHAHGAEIGHVGDSRCYRVRGHAIEPMTKDHSIVQEMVDAKMLSPADAKTHPDANRITRALGSRMEVRVDVSSVDYVAADVFILCSDGLTDVVDPDDILRIVTGGSAEQAVGQLVDLANARGGPDNITATVVRTRANAAARGVAKTLPDHPGDTVSAAPIDVVPAAAPKTLVQAPVALSSAPGSLPDGVAAASSLHELPRDEQESLVPERTPRKTPIGLIVAILVVTLGLAVGAFAIYKYQTTPKHVVPALATQTASAPGATPKPTAVATEDDDVEPLRPLSDGGLKD